LVPQRVMSKGRIWSEYQGFATSLKPEVMVFWIPERLSIVALMTFYRQVGVGAFGK
jgi:hypothetical protein